MDKTTCVNCENVYVSNSGVCDGHGAFARKNFVEGETIEIGLAKILNNCDGHENPLLFTWSDERPNKTWAVCSGCTPFYNSSSGTGANCEMLRDFNNNTFTIIASRNIKADEELFHTYRSLQWRECFSDIRST